MKIYGRGRTALALLLALVFAGGWSHPLLALSCPFAVPAVHCPGPSAQPAGDFPGERHPHALHEHDVMHGSAQESPVADTGAASSGAFFCDMVSCVQCHLPLAGTVHIHAVLPAGITREPQYSEVSLPSPLPSGVFHPPSLFSPLAI